MISKLFYLLLLNGINGFHWTSLERRDFITKFKLNGYVESHHIIPRQWRYHKNLPKSFDVDASYNLMFMPTYCGALVGNSTRRIHSGGHPAYNKYVETKLNNEEDCRILIKNLKQEIRAGNCPW